MEEVFLSAKTLTKDNKETFVDPAYARKRADFVLNSPRREFTLDALFNTCFLVVRDGKGNCAWGTHSINSPLAFGAGIMVDGVYASYAINRAHVYGDGARCAWHHHEFCVIQGRRTAARCRVARNGFVHGPYQYGAGIVEWDFSPVAAMNLL